MTKEQQIKEQQIKEYWNEKNSEVITRCPACERDITMLNNGGNGFCSDCAADH